MNICSALKRTKVTAFLIERYRNFFTCKSLKCERVPTCEIQDIENNDIKEIIARTFPVAGGNSVFLIQPYIKWGPLRNRKTSPELRLEESISLVNTLIDWNVAVTEIVPLLTLEKNTFFGSGKLEELKEIVQKSDGVSAIFVSVNMLMTKQHEFLESFFQLPVYDRYLIVMQIFREHARTAEAKLQISMAEIPYIWNKVDYSFHSSVVARKAASFGSPKAGHMFHEKRKLMLHAYEQDIKNSLEKLKRHRQAIRERRRELEFPIIAVVGYTNAGKTSIIKALTNEKELQPKNHLFATLDVTFHEGRLPNNLKVLYVDTIGFISDIPTELIEPFVVTLEDALNADVILHVQDASHPSYIAQGDHVNDTLKKMNIEKKLLDHCIIVANKIDLLKSTEEIEKDGIMLVSSTKFTGIEKLKLKLQEEVMKSTKRKILKIRLKTGSEEQIWLSKEAAITNVEADTKNFDYSFVTVAITELLLMKFKQKFIYNRKK